MSNSEEAEKEAHPFSKCVQRIVYSIRDVESCVDTLIPLCNENKSNEIESFKKQLEDLIELSGDSPSDFDAKTVAKFDNTLPKLNKIIRSHPDYQLKKGLLLSILASFDTFIGELLNAAFLKKT